MPNKAVHLPTIEGLRTGKKRVGLVNKCGTGRPELYGHLEESPSQVRRRIRKANTIKYAKMYPGTTPSLPWQPWRSMQMRRGVAVSSRKAAASNYKALTCPEGLVGAFRGAGKAGNAKRRVKVPRRSRRRETGKLKKRSGFFDRFVPKRFRERGDRRGR